jgi:hypothetical protein
MVRCGIAQQHGLLLAGQQGSGNRLGFVMA